MNHRASFSSKTIGSDARPLIGERDGRGKENADGQSDGEEVGTERACACMVEKGTGRCERRYMVA